MAELCLKFVKVNLCRSTELLWTMDPYFIMYLGSQQFTSQVDKGGNKEPKFSEVAVLPLYEEHSSVRIVLMDKETIGSDQVIGDVEISLYEVRKLGTSSHNVELKYNGNRAGSIQVEMMIRARQQQSSSFQQSMAFSTPLNTSTGMNYGNKLHTSQATAGGYPSFGSQIHTSEAPRYQPQGGFQGVGVTQHATNTPQGVTANQNSFGGNQNGYGQQPVSNPYPPQTSDYRQPPGEPDPDAAW